MTVLLLATLGSVSRAVAGLEPPPARMTEHPQEIKTNLYLAAPVHSEPRKLTEIDKGKYDLLCWVPQQTTLTTILQGS